MHWPLNGFSAKESGMALRGRWRSWVKFSVAAGLLGVGAAGCTNSKDDAAHLDVIPGDGKSPSMNIGADAGTKSTNDPKADRLHQSFADACTTEINADSGVALPPTFTTTQKNCGQLNESLQKIWNDIKFTTADGKRQTYILTLDVAQGERAIGAIEILMQPDLAPNHVRNFVALATLGYYDGLFFDRVIQEQGEQAKDKLVLLEAGSPADDADPASSHLGYWLKPEFSETTKHEAGSVGACLLHSDDNAETAAVRFYITLTPAPAMDGNFTIFAKVTKGLEVARELTNVQVKDPDGGLDQGRPLTPVVIRKVAVRAVPVVE
jgi:cyclophilin family peptidyl-prolyl cis-trans isomerase